WIIAAHLPQVLHVPRPRSEPLTTAAKNILSEQGTPSLSSIRHHRADWSAPPRSLSGVPDRGLAPLIGDQLLRPVRLLALADHPSVVISQPASLLVGNHV